MATELAAAYVTIIPSMQGATAKIKRELNGVDTSPVGKSLLSSLTGGAGQAASSITSVLGGVAKSAAGAFAGVATAGASAIAGIGTAIAGLTAYGGISRALNIEQANNMFKGLKFTTEQTASAMESANVAVKGTAFGLDAAAKAAALLSTSGVQLGDDMTRSLQAIAGTASMARSDMEDITSIFQKVAAKGKLSGEQLEQLNERGVNAIDALAQHLGVGRDAVSDMVSKGKIDFQTFSDAMYEAFGEAAYGANETFTGAMANVKAALSRLGAKVAMPALESLRKVLAALIPIIDGVSEALQPMIDGIVEVGQGIADKAVSALEAMGSALADGATLTDALAAAMQSLRDSGVDSSPFELLAEAIIGVVDGVKALGSAIADFATGFLGAIDWRAWADGLADIASHFDFLNEKTERGVTPAQELGAAVGDFVDSIRDSTAVQAFAQAIKDIGDSIKEAQESGDWGWLGAAGEVLGFVNEGLSELYGHLKEIDGAIQEWNGGEALEILDPSTWQGFALSLNAVGDAVQPAVDGLNGFFDCIAQGILAIGDFFTSLPEKFDGLLDSIGEFVQPAVDGLSGFFDAIVQGAMAMGEGLQGAFEAIGGFFSDLQSRAAEALGAVGGFLSSIPATAASMASGVRERFAEMVSFAQSVPSRIAGFFQSIPARIAGYFSTARSQVISVFNGMVSTVQSIPGRIVGFFSGIGQRISSAIGSIHFPTPHISWQSLDILGKSVSIPSVKFYANGGFVDGAQLMVAGEAGPEMVLPEEGRLMDRFSSAVAAKVERGVTVNASFYVNGAQDPEAFARKTLRSINRLAIAEGR